MQPPPQIPPVVHFGVFELDLQEGELRKGGLRIKLGEQSLQILAMLLERPGKIVTREELRQRLWPADTFVDFDHSLNSAVLKLREALGDQAQNPRFIATLHRRGYRFIASVDCLRPGLSSTKTEAAETATSSTSTLDYVVQNIDPKRATPQNLGEIPKTGWRARKALTIALPAVALVIVGAVAFSSYSHDENPRGREKLTDKDIIVVADFANRTGDSVFDDTLKQALAVDLQQSPFLSLLSEQRVRETLKLMGRSPADRVNEATAQEVCVRTGSAAVLSGSIASLGSEYVISLDATNCRTGDPLHEEQVQASRKEEVLQALDQAVTKLRSNLGESLRTVQKFDTPVEQATTPSLEALKVFGLAEKTALEKDESASIPLFKRAVELDPGFALAYSELGARYFDLGESGLAEMYIGKAFQLSDHVSDYERWWIADLYYEAVSGELGKANQFCQLWAEAYPRSMAPHARLGMEYEFLGQYEKAVTEDLKAMSLDPGTPDPSTPVGPYVVLMESYAALNKLSEAKKTYRRALDRGFDSAYLHADMYGIAFLEGDRDEMQRQVAWALGKPGAEDWLLSLESDTNAFYGRLGKAREFSQRAVESDRSNNEVESATLWQMNSALREAEFGYSERTRHETDVALAIASARDVQILAALALARVGDVKRSEDISKELEKRFPLSTVLNNYWLPTIRASNAIHRGNPAEAIRILEASAPYELGYPEPQFENGGQLYPVYVRGEAYLLLGQGQQAATEFQKMLQYVGILQNSPLHALSQLGLARAYALSHDKVKARAAYRDFLTLWKDADSDIPILKQAKAEYANLQ